MQVAKTCVAVVGLGYVGLPLALAFAEKGHDVIGIDTNQSRVEHIRSGRSFLIDIEDSRVHKALEKGMEVHSSFQSIGRADLVIVAVPTPLDDSGLQPDLTMVLTVAQALRSGLKLGASVCLESTVAPGTTEGPFLAALSESGLEPDRDFYLGYSPERINPGSPPNSFLGTPKLISGISRRSLNRLQDYYEKVFAKLVPVQGIREAEFAKLLENSYRLVNISLVNELALAAAKMGIDFREVLRAASTKPYGFQGFQPTAGAGGHCIPVDPVYLKSEIESATGRPQEILAAAVRVNESIADRFLDEILGGRAALENRRILVAGLTYKRGVADMRNSASLRIMKRVVGVAASVSVFDESSSTFEIDGQTYESVSLSQGLVPFDITIVLHDFPDDVLTQLSRVSNVLVSAVGFFGASPTKEINALEVTE